MPESERADGERWELSGTDLQRLLSEAEQVKGESLWNDAWRRLRRNRASWWSLLFLGCVGLLSFAAPLLPIPSPIALDLADEPQAPVPPWEELWNDGWDHRIVVDFAVVSPAGMPLEFNEDARAETVDILSEAVAQTSGHFPVASWEGAHGDYLLHLAIPYDESLLRRTEQDRGTTLLPERIETLIGASIAPDGSLDLAHGKSVTIELAGVVPRNGYWELGALDRGMVWLRHQLFGFGQIGRWLGTDSKGRDLLARIVWGSRVSIQVALAATLCSLLIGVTYGAFSGLAGGRIDNLMMRIVDILYSVPFIFVVIFFITIINEYRTELADIGIEYITVFYVVVGAIYWLTMARVVRGQVLQLKNTEFIEAARVLGASTRRILFVHLVPNVLSIVIVYLTLTIPAVMLFEAFLSFLGLGVEAPKVSWGLLAVDSTEAINPMKVCWWLVVWPAAAMGSTLLALNILGDGLRDALDPKLRGAD